jgi:DNA-binding SARP family transcriptional activator
LAYHLRVLGTPNLLDGNANPVPLSLGKPLALLVYVACHPSPVSRDELVEVFWPEADHTKGRHSVRQALWVLRSAVGEDLFDNEDPLSLREGALITDLQLFTDALGDGRIEDARAFWGGPVLDHFVLSGVRRWNQWVEDLRNDLERRFQKALSHYANTLKEAGEPALALSVLHQIIQVTPTAEAPHLARVELLLDLLRLDAAREALADAYQRLGDDPTATGPLAALEERLEQTIQEQQARVAEGVSFPLEFVGRSRELAGLQTLWRDSLLGRTRAGLITGASGIGKTRMAEEFISGVAGADNRAVTVKGTRAEMKVRWGAAADFVRQLLRLPGSAGISSASDSLLRAMLPSLGQDAINLQTVNGVSPAAIRDAVSDLLEAITFESPLVVLLDDYQWIDVDSRTLFGGLARRLREARVLFLFSGRSDLSSRHWESVEATLVDEAGARRFRLDPLSREEVGELLALGAHFTDPTSAEEVVARIHRASGGNPLFIREILKELHDKGLIRREEHGWVCETKELPKEMELPRNIRALLGERLSRLSEPAATLAATLAKEHRATSADILRRKTRLPEGILTQATVELLDHGVARWVDGTSLDFVHDLFRDTATAHLEESLLKLPAKQRWYRRARLGPTLAAGGLAALALGTAWEGGLFSGWLAASPPPYGGGTIVFHSSESPPKAFRIEEDPSRDLRPVSLKPTPPARARSTFRSPGGELIWYGADDTEDGPDLVRILYDGTRVPFFQRPGDQSLLDMSPDGSRVLLTSENVGDRRFSHSLYWVDLVSPEMHLIHEGRGPLGLGRWSGNGDMVAFNIVAASDSLAVYSLHGDRIWTRAFGEIYGITWCGEDLLLTAAPEGELFLFRVDLPEGTVTSLAPMALARGLVCSPDGSAAIHSGVVDGRPVAVLRDLATGQVYPLPDPSLANHVPHWIPDEVSSIPARVLASDDTLRLGWGEKRLLSASVLHSNGEESSEGIRWESLDPSVATVSVDQELVGNNPGVARILACWGHSLRDTVVAVVEDRGSGGPGAYFRDGFETLDTTRWIPFGTHQPRSMTLEEEAVLGLRGDEKYADGIILKEPIPLDQGVTVEFEFKMEVNREVHQNVSLCLRDTDPQRVDVAQGLFGPGEEVVCFLYPAREFEKMNPSQVRLYVTPGSENLVEVPEALPTPGWTHVAIQVRADGEPSLVINRQRVATAPIRIRTTPRYQWSAVIDGDAVGTQPMVRNFGVWREVRY